MRPAAQLAESERQRLLQAMGFDVWVRRGSEPLSAVANASTTARAARERTAPASAVVADSPRSIRSTTPAIPRAAAAEPAAVRPTALRMGHQTILLILEKRVHADAPLIRQLMKTLPGCMVCTPDTVSRGAAKFALQIGVEASLPVDVLGVRVPALAALQQSASARRSLWWSIKPMLRSLKG